MSRKIFLTFPAHDLEKSKAFWTHLGFTLNPQFSGDGVACVILSDVIHLMLGTHAKFGELTPGTAIADAWKVSQVLTSLTCESRQAVDDLVDRALAAGARAHEGPQDHGFMYARSFQDPDGHGWNWIWMNPEHGRE